MTKRIIFSLIGIFILLAIGGGVWWWENTKIPEEWEFGFSLAGNYIIYNTPEGKIVENKKEGLKLKVPNGWRVEKKEYFVTLAEGTVSVLSPDFELEKGKNLTESFKKGCLIEFGIRKYKNKDTTSSIREVHNFIIETKRNPERMRNFGNRSYEVITINGQETLKEITTLKKNEDSNLKYISIKIPGEDKIYLFRTYLFSENKEKCEQEFNKFLETVSIK